MAERSSTSNSDDPSAQPTKSHSRAAHRVGGGMPVALMLAIGIVCAVEIFLRTRDPHSLIAYPELAASDDQTVTYVAAREFIATDSPADIALIGSSQMREGVWMPALIDDLRSQLGDVRVANYALRGARADAMEAVTQYLATHPRPPKLAVIGLSVRDLRGAEPDVTRMAVFWDFSRWTTELRAHGFDAAPALPVVIRNGLGKISYTLRYRDQIAMDLTRPLKPLGIDYRREGNPIIGETTFQLTGGRGLKTLEIARTRISMRRMLARARDSYAWAESPEPSPAMVQRLRSMLTALKERGIAVVIVEMGVAEPLQNDLIAADMATAFDNTVSRIASEEGVRFIPAEVQPFKLGEVHFSDLQHHNRPGAEIFGKWLAGEIVPIFKESLAGSYTRPPATGPASP
ncbi:MAG: hypothetical protein H7144_01610 [Burkholderiales bacterium]|nr:hypothetical protein [Phycisphaerae bacterium]